MEIKSNRTKCIFSRSIQTINARTKTFLFLLIGVLLLAMAFSAGALMHRAGLFTEPFWVIKKTLKEPLSFPLKYLRLKLAHPERIYIDIGFANLQKLEYWRRLALERGTLYDIPQDFVKAQIRYKDEVIPVRIRLKGGMADQHMAGKRWSMRVEIRGGKTLFGMNRFALMDPQRRNFMLEWLLRRVMKEEGIVSKRYKFIEVVINGQNKGIYALDEHYGRIMLENNQRRDGPVIRFAQEAVWFDTLSCPLSPAQGDDHYYALDVDAIDSGKILRDEALSKQFAEACHLLNAFRGGDLMTHEVFDLDKLAKWMALSDILGAWHGVSHTDVKFYYNPITSKLEPAPDDSFNETTTDPGDRIFRLNDQYNKGAFLKRVFSDLKFIERYIQELERVSQESYLDNILNSLSAEIAKNVDILHKDCLYYEFPKEQLYKNQKSIREILNPYKGITAYLEEKRPHSVILSLASTKIIPVEIINVTYKEKVVLEPTHLERVVLPGKEYAAPCVFKKIEFSFPAGFAGLESPSDLVVNYKLLGTSRLRSEVVFPWAAYHQDFVAGDFIRQQPNFQEFAFIKENTPFKEISVNEGDWTLDSSLIIPQGYTFIVQAGTKLNLSNAARILSYSPLKLVGTEERPIIISSPDCSGQGIAVLNAGKESLLENVVFENLSAPAQDGWQLTGAITFYESPVSINKCRFLKNNSEDLLNIVRSRFIITNSFFSNTTSDAFDTDFGEGVISNTTFVDCGNDAMDFSGSVIDISNTFVNGAGDKGISAGENSQVTVRQVEIKNSHIGIASKDLSETTVEDIQIYDSQIGFAVYQKKPEFGPATISVQKASLVDVPATYLVEEGSMLSLNGEKIGGTQRDVAKRVVDQN